ncbi:MAG: thioredoxin [candidate division WOR-3 bacterium]|nr:thioredoxin [candidate division WOR-3 bacterium]
MAIELNEKNFQQEILDSSLPALVDFWASWCMPCQMIASIIDELSKEYQGKLKVGKVNVDNEPKLAEKYSIMSIPSLMLFKNGQVVDTIVGAVPKSYLVEHIEKILSD